MSSGGAAAAGAHSTASTAAMTATKTDVFDQMRVSIMPPNDGAAALIRIRPQHDPCGLLLNKTDQLMKWGQASLLSGHATYMFSHPVASIAESYSTGRTVDPLPGDCFAAVVNLSRRPLQHDFATGERTATRTPGTQRSLCLWSHRTPPGLSCLRDGLTSNTHLRTMASDCSIQARQIAQQNAVRMLIWSATVKRGLPAENH